MSPVREIGRGKNRRYQDPVKVKLLTDHSVRITEQDGDQFSISSSGKIKSITQNTRMGSSPARLHANVYEEDDSIEQIYYGRGYVQLT